MIQRKTPIRKRSRRESPMSQVERVAPVLIAAMRNGMSPARVHSLVDISSATFGTWKKRYKEMMLAMDRLTTLSKKRVYLSKLSEHEISILKLFSRMRRASTEHINQCLQRINDAAKPVENIEDKKVYGEKVFKDGTRIRYLKEHTVIKRPPKSHWYAAAWLLEKRYPEDFGKNRNIEDDAISQLADNIHSMIEVVDEDI